MKVDKVVVDNNRSDQTERRIRRTKESIMIDSEVIDNKKRKGK